MLYHWAKGASCEIHVFFIQLFHIMDQTKKTQCTTCSGVGLVKGKIIVCDTCNKTKCMCCNSTGSARQPYERCETCYGDGEVDETFMNQKRKRQCTLCNGVGLIKPEIIVCDTCNGVKCMCCNSTRIVQQPYERCETCYGDGEVNGWDVVLACHS